MARVNVAPGKPISLGEDSKITLTIASTVYDFCVRTGSVTEDPAEISSTTNCDGGFNTRVRGPRNCVIDVEMQWDYRDMATGVQGNPLAGPPQLEPGDDFGGLPASGEGLQVWPDFTHAPEDFFYLPVIYVVTNVVRLEAEGVQVYTSQFKNQGAYYSPQRPFAAPPP